MRTIRLLSAIGLFLALSSATAQKMETNGLQTANVTTVHGTVRINLPDRVHAGDRISGTVRVEPSGTTEKQKAKAQKTLSEYAITLGTNTWNTQDDPQPWNVSKTTGTQQLFGRVLDAKGDVVGSFPIQVNPTPRSNMPAFSGYKSPAYFRSGYTEQLYGNFDGNATNTSVQLGGQIVPILTESPEGIVCQIPESVSGSRSLTVTENGSSSTTTCNVLDMKLAMDNPNLSRGDSATMEITVLGLQDITTPVNVVLANNSPDVVSLEGGQQQVLTIQPKDARPNGIFSKKYIIRAYRTGAFDISCTLEAGPFQPEDENPNDSPESNNQQDTFVFSQSPYSSGNDEVGPDGHPISFGYSVVASAAMGVIGNVSEEDIQEERNKGRELPEDTPLGPRDPDARGQPYSRPVPPGIRTPEFEQGKIWKDLDAMLEDANGQIEEAENHMGPIVPGIPGFHSIGATTPGVTFRHYRDGVHCTEKVYYASQYYYYLSDRSLLVEEQLSPSYEFFIAEGETRIKITKTKTGWEIGASAKAGKGPVEVEISGKYGKTTTEIDGKAASNLLGRHLWLFHVGRLYLVRKAYLVIDYKYHYKVCSDGTSSNWVETSYSNNWAYWYEWEEELFVASRDDEGNFHRVEDFPPTKWTKEQNMNIKTSPMESLDSENIIDPNGKDFFPEDS